jgi:hypothetical protein
MNTPTVGSSRRAVCTTRVTRAAAAAMFAFTSAMAASPLTITSPTSGVVVVPGQSLAITVAVSSGSYPRGIAVLAQDPLGAAGPLAGSVLTFYLTLPAVTPPGTYSVVAAAPNSTGILVQSPPMNVDVERADTASSLSLQPTAANLPYIGASLPLTVMGAFPGSLLVDLTRSSKLMVISENASVATVQIGFITATGPGKTNIDVIYGLNTVKLPVTVPASIRGDLNGDGRVDQSDLNVILAAVGTPATGPYDARDLNGDGKIDVQDARILVSLCAEPHCGITRIPDGSILEESFDE